MIKNFFKCGICGWCLEIMFTAFESFRKREMCLKGNTSIWMFPIYGCGALIHPLSRLLKNISAMKRGIIYTFAIFLVEFLTGSYLKEREICPWDYSRARYNIKGVIRLDYALWWFLTGLLFETVLDTPNRKFRMITD